MARPRKDKFEETSIGFEKGTEHEIVHVSIPFWVNVTFKTPVGKGENGKIYYGTHSEVWKESAFDEKVNKKEFQKKGMKVIKIEDATTRLPNICEKCHKKGIPRIERKSNRIDYHARAIDPLTESPNHNVKTNRRDEYWLIYDHKTESKKCRVAQFDKNHFLFKQSHNRTNRLDKHFFPHYLEWIKKDLIA